MPLRCSLIETRISDNNVYKALSYTWGTPVFPRVLRVDNDGILTITENLDTALRRLRDYRDPIELWVDAVCIDQQDEEEKFEQIRFMDQIYQNAATVLVVQEVVLNANVKFLCGDAEIEWMALGRLVSDVLPLYQGYDVVVSTNREVLQSVTQMFHLWQRYALMEGGSGATCGIAHLLESFHFLQCYDPKDYLYTICRLAEDIDLVVRLREGSHFASVDYYRGQKRLYAKPGNLSMNHSFNKSEDTIRIWFNNQTSLQEAFVDFAFRLANHGLLDWVLSQRLARMKPDIMAWPSWVPMWNYGILRSASLIGTLESNIFPRSRNRLLSYRSKTTGPWTARMSHTVLPAYQYTKPLQLSMKENTQDGLMKELAQQKSNSHTSHTSHNRSDDRLPWEIRWRSTTLPSPFDDTDQVTWLRITYQNLLEQFMQMAQSFMTPGESLASHLETLLLQTLLKILIEPLQTANAQIDKIEPANGFSYPVADSMQYVEPFLSLARTIEGICRGCYPLKAAMDTAMRAAFKVLGSQCLFVAEYRSFEDSSPALPAVHIGVAPRDIAKGDKILSDGNTNVRTVGIRTGFIFRGDDDTTVKDMLLTEDYIWKDTEVLKPWRPRNRPGEETHSHFHQEEGTSEGIEFFSGTYVLRDGSESISTRRGYVYEIIGHCLLVTPDFSTVWSYHTPMLRFCEARVKAVVFYLK
ncbi:putative Heterokaryon incompatibility domain-containing protein [Seiridium unicorne]|uniref:Heterokaryon incompatibility domain-containing protein n=1 Tax=Seiridium unicorne TaxID=138068 RepID=A0ABR2UUC4_9PEZI